MELIDILIEAIKRMDPTFTVALFAALIAFVSWIIKGLVEKPLQSSRETFTRITDKRIEILTEIKTRLVLVSYFPYVEGKEFKMELQTIFKKDGRVGFLDRKTFASVLKLSIDENTDEKLLLSTIEDIDIELSKHISKIQEELKFYNKFSNFNPIKRVIGFLLLAIEYITTLTFICFIIYNLYSLLSISSPFVGTLILTDTMLLVIVINKLFNRFL